MNYQLIMLLKMTLLFVRTSFQKKIRVDESITTSNVRYHHFVKNETHVSREKNKKQQKIKYTPSRALHNRRHLDQ